MTRALAALSMVAFAAGCEGVPSLTFEEAGPEGGNDGGVAEAGDAGAAGSGCPGAVPAGAALCCASVPCYGSACSQSNCFQCAGCMTHQVCCLKSSGSLGCAPDTLASCR